MSKVAQEIIYFTPYQGFLTTFKKQANRFAHANLPPAAQTIRFQNDPRYSPPARPNPVA